MDSTSSGSETSASLGDYFTELTAKLRGTFKLGAPTCPASKTLTEKPAESVQIPSESFPPSLYDIPQLQQEQIPPLYESGPGDASVQSSAGVNPVPTTPIKSSEKSKKRKVTVSLTTQSAIDKIYSKKSSMTLPSDSDDVFASDTPSEQQDPNTSAPQNAVEDDLSLVDMGNPELLHQQNLPWTSSGVTYFSSLGLE